MSSVASTSSRTNSGPLALHHEHDYKSGGSAGFPKTKAENADGKKQLSNGMYRQHRIMTDEELSAGKETRWMELEIHGLLLASFFCSRNYCVV